MKIRLSYASSCDDSIPEVFNPYVTYTEVALHNPFSNKEISITCPICDVNSIDEAIEIFKKCDPDAISFILNKKEDNKNYNWELMVYDYYIE